MTRLVWNAVGNRRYHTGVDRGVLAVEGLPVVPWDGLISVEERPENANVKSFYLDGRKTLVRGGTGDFSATISAYSSPVEFDECDGTKEFLHGISASNQPRKRFNFAYRTLNGNDVFGVDGGYTLHLVYNAMAEPTVRQNETMTENSDVLELTWDVLTTPTASVSGVKPTAHYSLDTAKVPKKLITAIEDLLYGTETSDPEFPSMADLINALVMNPPISRRNLAVDSAGLSGVLAPWEQRVPVISTLEAFTGFGYISFRQDQMEPPPYDDGAILKSADYLPKSGGRKIKTHMVIRNHMNGTIPTLQVQLVQYKDNGLGTMVWEPYSHLAGDVVELPGADDAETGGVIEIVLDQFVDRVEEYDSQLAIWVDFTNPTPWPFMFSIETILMDYEETFVPIYFDGASVDTAKITYEYDDPDASPAAMSTSSERSWYT